MVQLDVSEKEQGCAAGLGPWNTDRCGKEIYRMYATRVTEVCPMEGDKDDHRERSVKLLHIDILSRVFPMLGDLEFMRKTLWLDLGGQDERSRFHGSALLGFGWGRRSRQWEGKEASGM